MKKKQKQKIRIIAKSKQMDIDITIDEKKGDKMLETIRDQHKNSAERIAEEVKNGKEYKAQLEKRLGKLVVETSIVK